MPSQETTARLLLGLAAAAGITDDLAGTLADLLRAVTTAVPSALSVSVVVDDGAVPVTVTWPRATPVAACSSVAFSLVDGDATPVVILLRAAAPAACDALGRDLAGLLDVGARGSRRVVVDGHLEEPLDGGGRNLEAALNDRSVVDRAVGTLVATGLPPDEARARLGDLARDSGLPVARVARRLLAETAEAPGRPDRGDHAT